MESPFPPFDPDGDNLPTVQATETPTRLRDVPLRTIFPNVLTLLAICSGLTSIRFAIEGRLELAVAAIIFAAFLDGIDGRVARFLKSTTRFGAEMDSLADFVNFGVAPALLLYFTILNGLPFGWTVSLVYASCACLRLARFNVTLDDPNQPEWQYRFFVGVPAPAGALLALLPIYVQLLGVPVNPIHSGFSILFTLGCGLLMVSNIPTFSGKNISEKIRSDLFLPIMILAVFLTAVLLSYPWKVLAAVAILYLISIPFSVRNWRRYNARAE